MKQVMVICDGMADNPSDFQDGLTPLAVAHTPNMDSLAREGRSGNLITVPDDKYVGSEAAILSILGYRPEEIPTGRGPLEAAGLGIEIPPDTSAARYILSDSIDPNDIRHDYPHCRFLSMTDMTGLCIFPDEYGQRLLTDCRLKIWSKDKGRIYRKFGKLHRKKDGRQSDSALIGKVALVKGIARECGLKWMEPEGATGDVDTDYRKKGETMIEAIITHDIVIVHIEACDAASHRKDLKSKIKAIENIDRHIIAPLRGLLNDGKDISIAVISDHATLCSSGNHSRGATPALCCFRGIEPDSVGIFSEKEARNGSLKDISELWKPAEYF